MAKNSRVLLAVIASATAVCVRSALAEDSSSSPQMTLSPIYAADTEPATDRAPLMAALDRVGLAEPLESARIDLSGWVEGSYNYNFMNPAKELNLGHDFDIHANHATINQLVLNVERDVDLTSHQFDIGGRIEFLYGSDAAWTHANGLYRAFRVPLTGPDFQFDTPDMYVDLAFPIGNGLRVRAGRFEFWKPLDPNASVFFSHTFAYNAALPFTNTGITAAYNFNQQWSLEAGISRGDDQATNDDNGAIDFIGKLAWRPSDQLAVALYGSIGPEQPGDNADYLFRLNPTVTWNASDNLSFLADAVYAHQQGNTGNGFKDSYYGISGNAVLKLDQRFSLAGRLEWFRDETGLVIGRGGNFYEATVGMTVTPFPTDPVGSNFKVRPEVRYDYASRDFFNGLTRHDQLIAALDAIFDF